ncbi:electron transfer flavoprotein subunit alpha, mitochondrial-like isoform X4 [Carya illinoinensis]|uniref:electron transfer flavoprotein subunit alpha, mitochondrial-like isoform X4 n=1 Tax=Carya illinoinensis TaxID=32201 RepID=UPI001C71A9A0|nr:electron transfer flavoprotein subunit alpha, mitochondrial-like isoform X4 [Carya illinoinensis]
MKRRNYVQRALQSGSLASRLELAMTVNSPFSLQASTLVLAENEAGSIRAPSVSAVVAAIVLSKDNSITVLLAGSGPSLREAATHAASCHPSVSQVLVADSDKFTHPIAEPWAKLVHLVQQRGDYSHIIAPSVSFGKNILPRAAALLDVSPITDVIEIAESDLFVRPIYAGNALCTVRYTGANPCMLTIRSTSFPVPPTLADSKSKEAPISQVALSTFGEGNSRYIKQTSQDTERPDLGNARIVITGGRGLKSAENFKMIEKLAEKLGAAGDLFEVIPEFLEKVPERK